MPLLMTDSSYTSRIQQPRRHQLRVASTLLMLVPLVLTSACSIQANKNGSDGDSDHVKISTPLGGLNVRSKDMDAASLGLPQYPGAHMLTKGENGNDDGQVDLHMGFGPWQMRIKVVSFATPDARDKVLAFYRNALGKYGDVVECDGKKAVGTPSVTKEGLGCDDQNSGPQTKWSEHGAVNINDNDIELKAGSKHRQHIVGFKKSNSGESRFALISLELPSGSSDEQTN